MGVAVANKWRLHLWLGSFVAELRNDHAIGDDLAELRFLVMNEEYEEALALAAALLPEKEDDSSFLEAARNVFIATGALTLNAQALAALRRISDSPELKQQERRVRGRITETDPNWLPHIPDIGGSTSGNPEKVMHLLKISVPYRQSGYSMRSQYLIDGQRADGLDPIVVTAPAFPRSVGVSEFPPVEMINGTSYFRLGAESPHVPLEPYDAYLDHYAQQVAPLIAKLNPSVLHVHSGHRGYDNALVGLALARKFGLPFVYEVRGFFESLWSRDLAWNERGETYRRRYATETRCMRAADAIVTLSELMKAEIVARGVAPDRVFVIPNGVEPDRFQPGPKDRYLVDTLGLEGKLVFGYVSNLDHYREGHELLIKAAARLAERKLPAKALIIGDGRRREELEQLVTSEGAEEVVLFTGQVPHDEVLTYYRLLDVFVVPRIPERAARLVTPLKPFEAMAAGIPLVMSALPSLSEIVGEGDRGLLFPPGDADALADVLSSLWQSDDMGASMAETARSWVINQRSWTSLARGYKEVYRAARNN
jgi:glycosyltransferase involved in cell wall biosynthesis